MKPQTIYIELRRSEALVLLSWLSRFNGSGDAAFEDQAEERALWDLEASLERIVVAPFQEDYEAALREAREDVRDPGEL